MVGDGSYLMPPGDLVTAVAEGVKIIIVLLDNQGYASIGSLSRSVGSFTAALEEFRPAVVHMSELLVNRAAV